MGILHGLLRGRRSPLADPDVVITLECGHPSLIPHWERPRDAGDEDKASWFTCGSCDARLSLVQVQAQRIAEDWLLHEELFSRGQ